MVSGQRPDSPEDLPREVELKLELDAVDIPRLRGHPLLKEAFAAAGKPKRLVSTYFDTPDLRLRAEGLSVRIRRDGRRRIQTVKSAAGQAAGLFDRGEWEVPVPGDGLDLSAAAGTALAPLLDHDGVRENLAPIFTVTAKRTTLELANGVWAAEMTIDDGTVQAGELADRLCEIEIELRRGTPADLFAIARSFGEAAPLRLGIRTKADRGYALVSGETLKAVKGSDAGVVPGMSVADAFQAIGRACLRHFLMNEPALRLERQPEAVHQMRVALRRLRAAISIFRNVVDDPQRAVISGELKWMAGELGNARDLDVFIAKVVRPASAARPDDAQLEALAHRFAERRREAYDEALAALGSARYRMMLIDTAAWIEAGPWLAGEAHAEPVDAFAARILAKRARKIRREGAALAEMAPEERHELRIAVKKLRYASEFFSPVFGRESKKARKRAKVFLGAVEDLQEHLGDLNDASVGAGMGALVGLDGAALARVYGREETGHDEDALAGTLKAFKAFRKADPFWD